MDPGLFKGGLGKLVQSSRGSYATFEPAALPLKINYDEELIKLLAEAVLSVGSLSAMGKQLKNPHLMIKPYLRKEAVLSSKIEGTKTSLSEVFLHEKVREIESPDMTDVLNYIKALEYGLGKVKEKPITEELIKNMHQILLKGSRGEDKNPGEYKDKQNWIGDSYDIMEAKFVPASPETTPALMSNLIGYINEYTTSTDLIKAGVMHYQFETIHPFRDGNGRLGRLLVILYLCRVKVLSQPFLYLSAYFERNRSQYHEMLFEVSSKGKIEDWLKFFLKGVKFQADAAVEKATKLEEYREYCKTLIQEKTYSLNSLKIIEELFKNPYIIYADVERTLNSHHPTAKRNIDLLIKLGIIKELAPETKKGKIFYAPKIKEILEK